MSDEKQVDSSPSSEKRRDALKKVVTVGGVSVAVSQWSKPVVESVVLPAHAQTTEEAAGAAGRFNLIGVVLAP